MDATEPHPMVSAPDGAACMSVLLAATVQDTLMTATHDLERLQGLLEHAVTDLMRHFSCVHQQLASADASGDERLHRIGGELRSAITALQFQDMASQLITHTSRRLRYCADQLAREALSGDEDGEAVIETPPDRPNPVTQDEMDAGSVELF